MNAELESQLRERVIAAGLEAHAEAILARARPAVDFTIEDTSSGEIGEHRFGGAPDLPPSIPWPRLSDGQAFVFLMQINLSQIPTWQESPLPARGMMWFFVGLDEPATDVEHRIILWQGDPQGDEELSPAIAPPLGEMANENYAEMPPQRLRAELRADVPNYSTNFGGLGEQMSQGEQDAMGELARCDGDCIGQLLGLVRGVGSDPREDAFVVREVGEQWLYDYPKRGSLDMSRAQAWQNLLCLFSLRAGELDFCVWDAGYLIFLIREDDLAALEMARVYAAVETS